MTSAMRLGWAGAAVTAAFLWIYLPDAGHGFIKDDFGWIRSSASNSPSEFFALFQGNVGFYRPLVSATFAADFALWHLNPFGYGVTNILLCAATAVLLFALMRRFALPAAAALLGTAVWAFNFHGINMALLWLSGRTALLVSLFSFATVHAFLNGRRLTAGVLCLGALLCKEEAVMLPAILAGFIATEGSRAGWRMTLRRAVRETWPLWASLVVYAILRMNSGAFGPSNAPSYYRFSLSLPLVLRNLREYADRAGTAAFAVALVLAAALGRRPPPLTDNEHRSLRFAGLWIVGTYALTVFLPVRSNLYAVLPSCGSAVAVAVCGSVLLRTSPDRFRTVAAALLVLTLLLIPIYRGRDARWVGPADASARVMRTLQMATAAKPAGGRIVLIDDPQERVNLDAAFGTLFADAVVLFLGQQWTGEIRAAADAAATADLAYRYQGGVIVPDTTH